MGSMAAALKWGAVVVAAVAVAFVLLCAYAAPRTGLSWRGSATPLAAARFAGGAPQPDGSLVIERAAGAAQQLLRFTPDAPLRGRFLSYRFAGMPPSLRLGIGWRTRADGAWHWAMLPFPRRRTTVDLARLSPDWTGEADSLAFTLLPAELLPPSAVPAVQLRLLDAELQTDARLPALAALMDEWHAYRPWSGRSINTGGFDLRLLEPLPLQGFVLLVLAAAALVLLLVRAAGRWRRRMLATALVATATGWLVLDVAQLRVAWQRSTRLETLHQAAGGALAVEPRLAEALARVRAHPVVASPGARLVVFAGNPFLQSWPVFALLPLDVAALPADSLGRLRRGAVVLRLGEAGEYRDGVLRSTTHQAWVRELQGEPGVHLLQLLADPEPLP